MAETGLELDESRFASHKRYVTVPFLYSLLSSKVPSALIGLEAIVHAGAKQA
jgi:hypothetical protein